MSEAIIYLQIRAWRGQEATSCDQTDVERQRRACQQFAGELTNVKNSTTSEKA